MNFKEKMIKLFKHNEIYYFVHVDRSNKKVSQVREKIYDGSYNHYKDGSFRKRKHAEEYRNNFIKKGYIQLNI